jgi:hypothetical protein
MTGRVHQVWNRGRISDDGELIRCAGPQPGARSCEAGLRGARHELTRRIKQPANAVHCSAFVEARILDCRPDQNGIVLPRHDITALSPDHTPQRFPTPGELQELPADRLDGHAVAGATNGDLARPTTGCEHDGTSGQRVHVCLDRQIAADRGNGPHARGRKHLRAMVPGGGRQCLCQLGGRDKAVARDQQPSDHTVGQLRLLGPHRGGVQQLGRHAPVVQHRGSSGELLHRGVEHRRVERAGAAVRDRPSAGGGHIVDERVE